MPGEQMPLYCGGVKDYSNGSFKDYLNDITKQGEGVHLFVTLSFKCDGGGRGQKLLRFA